MISVKQQTEVPEPLRAVKPVVEKRVMKTYLMSSNAYDEYSHKPRLIIDFDNLSSIEYLRSLDAPWLDDLAAENGVHATYLESGAFWFETQGKSNSKGTGASITTR